MSAAQILCGCTTSQASCTFALPPPPRSFCAPPGAPPRARGPPDIVRASGCGRQAPVAPRAHPFPCAVVCPFRCSRPLLLSPAGWESTSIFVIVLPGASSEYQHGHQSQREGVFRCKDATTCYCVVQQSLHAHDCHLYGPFKQEWRSVVRTVVQAGRTSRSALAHASADLLCCRRCALVGSSCGCLRPLPSRRPGQAVLVRGQRHVWHQRVEVGTVGIAQPDSPQGCR